MDISGKVAIVTGAASGIGRASALALAGAGASVAIADIDPAGGEDTVRMIDAAGGRAIFIEADVATPAGIRAVFTAAEEAFGGVDIVLNNAAMASGGQPSWPETSLERLNHVVATNLGGVVMGTRAAVDAFSKRGGGVVVNTGSLAALAPMPFDPAYIAAKAGSLLFTQSCKPLKESHNIRVNTILLGFVKTPFHAQFGDGTTSPDWLRSAICSLELIAPEDVAAVVLELVRDDTLAGEVRTFVNQPKVSGDAPGAMRPPASQRSTTRTN